MMFKYIVDLFKVFRFWFIRSFVKLPVAYDPNIKNEECYSCPLCGLIIPDSGIQRYCRGCGVCFDWSKYWGY